MCDVSSAEVRTEAGAPDLIERLTPEIVDAGVLAFLNVDRRFDSLEKAILGSFIATATRLEITFK